MGKNSELDELVAMRCTAALEECEEYLETEYNSEMSESDLRLIAEGLIYKKAIKDAFELMKYFGLV